MNISDNLYSLDLHWNHFNVLFIFWFNEGHFALLIGKCCEREYNEIIFMLMTTVTPHLFHYALTTFCYRINKSLSTPVCKLHRKYIQSSLSEPMSNMGEIQFRLFTKNTLYNPKFSFYHLILCDPFLENNMSVCLCMYIGYPFFNVSYV